MFSSSVNPNRPLTLQAKALPTLVRKVREQIGQVGRQVQWQICERIQRDWQNFQPRVQQQALQGREAQEQYAAQQGEQDGIQLAQQLRPVLEEAVGPMRPGMQEIHRRSPKEAQKLVRELAGVLAQIGVGEDIYQGGQKAEAEAYEETQDRLQARQARRKTTKVMQRKLQPMGSGSMAQEIWELFGFAIDEL
ncbi:MAG: hypothetical protein LBF94_00545 [Puniceicoccales bacterium]|nr:hypothetical protein [Puniceicoccales bacterium]